MIALDAVVEQLVQKLNVLFEADALSYFVQMCSANSCAEFRIVQQQVS